MNEQQEQARFDGYAIVDVLGHQRYAGYVRTEAYGSAVLFRIDVPALPEREYVLESPEYVGGRWTPQGATVKREATAGYTKLVGAGSIYSLTPCDEPAALKAVETIQRPELKLVSLPAGQKSLPVMDSEFIDPEIDDGDDEYDLDEDGDEEGEQDDEEDELAHGEVAQDVTTIRH